jgi:hypothetical protein
MSDMFTFRDQLQTGDTTGGRELEGYDVEATDGSIGTVLTASYEAAESHLVVDTGSWLLSKKVVLPAGVVARVDRDQKRVYVNRTKDQIKDAPEFDEATYADSGYREQLSGYYGRADR